MPSGFILPCADFIENGCDRRHRKYTYLMTYSSLSENVGHHDEEIVLHMYFAGMSVSSWILWGSFVRLQCVSERVKKTLFFKYARCEIM